MKLQTDPTKIYNKSNVEQRAKIVHNLYETRNGKKIYTTSRDFNLRELEIGFIIESIRKITMARFPRILDIGCGNGYTDICIAKKLRVDIVGIDFSNEMIKGAEYLKEKTKDELIGNATFQLEDIRKLNWDSGSFDVAISERCLLNLPNEDTQRSVIREVHRVLKKGGIYVMVEGTRNGLRRLNELRIKVGLEAIPDRAEDNVSSLKFEEERTEEFLLKYFKIIKKQYFGMYYLISRVVHPLLVYPNQPKFNAKINEVARKIATLEPDYNNIGSTIGYILEKYPLKTHRVGR